VRPAIGTTFNSLHCKTLLCKTLPEYLLLQVWVALTLSCLLPFEGHDSLIPRNLHPCLVPLTLTLSCCCFTSDGDCLCPLLKLWLLHPNHPHLYMASHCLLTLHFPDNVPCGCSIIPDYLCFFFLPLMLTSAT